MRKIYLFIFCFTTFRLFGQDTTKVQNDSLLITSKTKVMKREVHLGLFDLLINKRINLGYEHFLKGNQSLFGAVLLNDETEPISMYDIGDDFGSFSFVFAYIPYFSKKEHAGIFASPFISYRHLKNYDFAESTSRRDPYFGYGLKVGKKFVNKRLTFAPQFTVSRNIFLGNTDNYRYIPNTKEALLSLNFYMAYRF